MISAEMHIFVIIIMLICRCLNATFSGTENSIAESFYLFKNPDYQTTDIRAEMVYQVCICTNFNDKMYFFSFIID